MEMELMEHVFAGEWPSRQLCRTCHVHLQHHWNVSRRQVQS